jgi:hypothetical protein
MLQKAVSRMFRPEASRPRDVRRRHFGKHWRIEKSVDSNMAAVRSVTKHEGLHAAPAIAPLSSFKDTATMISSFCKRLKISGLVIGMTPEVG